MPEDLSGLVTTPSTWIPRAQVPRQRQLGLGEDNVTLLVANWTERWREPSTAPHSPEGRRATDLDWLS